MPNTYYYCVCESYLFASKASPLSHSSNLMRNIGMHRRQDRVVCDADLRVNLGIALLLQKWKLPIVHSL